MVSGRGDGVDRLPGPLQLAYLGDAVWELHVRETIVGAGPAKLDDMHRQAVERVHAAAQAALLHSVEHRLTDDEREVVRRGRNAKSHGPRGVDPADYRYSTAFECLLGYLHFTGRHERLQEVLRMADEAHRAAHPVNDAPDKWDAGREGRNR